MLKLVFEPTIISSLWSIRYCSVNTETEPNLPIPNFLDTKFFFWTDQYQFLKNRICNGTEEPNRSVRYLPNAQGDLKAHDIKS